MIDHFGSWEIGDWGTFLGIVFAIVGAAYGVWHKQAPKIRKAADRVGGALDAIAGRDAYFDAASGRRVPALKPLTERLANVETAVVEIKDVIKDNAEIRAEMHALSVRVDKLEDVQLDRRINQAESAQMWRAIADGDDPDLTPPSLDPPNE